MTADDPIDHWTEQARRILTMRGYSSRTLKTYLSWIRRFLGQYPSAPVNHLTRAHVEAFIESLTKRARLAPKSRNQAASALAFFFREVLGSDELDGLPRAKEPKRIPVVLSHRQAKAVLNQLSGKYRLIAALLYGCGLRLTAAHQIRVKDLDFDDGQIAVRDGKGGKDRWVMLPRRLDGPLRRQVERVRSIHQSDLDIGAGWASLPFALARKDRVPGWSSAGSSCFLRADSPPTPSPDSGADTSSTPVRRNDRSSKQAGAPESQSPSRATRSDGPSPLRCCAPATMFGPSRSSWAIGTCARP